MTRVGLIGLGRTGSIVARELLNHPDFQLVMSLVSPGSARAGLDIGEYLGIGSRGLSIKGGNHLESELTAANPQVIVDFTSPEACLRNIHLVARHEKPIIIGTTGFDSQQIQFLRMMALQNRAPILFAPNMTLGINVLMNLVIKTAEVLPNWDIEIIETHHRHKKDAPSGTAVKIGKLLADHLDRPEESISFGHERVGQRGPNTIAIHAVRGGGVVGVHQVVFLSENEKLEIRHESFSRSAFVECLEHLIRFAVLALPGFYTVEEVLGLVPPGKRRSSSTQADIA
ncbi:MAG: 4-hydroxy-tetrahydrodipicolinate reductase [Firmicutes bacterium]|nr:4-hydroxy-tetrahydrodipicolinate reductase [Bacillota bacterium]